MFDFDKWQEIFETIRKNKLRTFLTAFSVAWGIFILIILLGSGTGLQKGVIYQFRDDANNSIWIRPGTTSMPYRGLEPGRSIRFRNEDYNKTSFQQGVEHSTARYYISGNVTVSYNQEFGPYAVRGVHPDHQHLEKTFVVQGRFLNPMDLAEVRKVCAIGRRVQSGLFKGVNPIGKYINVNNIPFRVVGTYGDDGGEGEEELVYIPITTAQRAFGDANRINMMMVTTGDATVAESEKIAERIRQQLSQRHSFSPEDRRALRMWNNNVQFARYSGLIDGIKLFLWFIGIGTVLIGVVGVSNIMMIVVAERTREIGIRKALGATPGSIVSLILLEALFITTVAGYIGLVAGVGLLELVKDNLLTDFFRQPEADFRVALGALAVLVVAGLAAGFFPALRAARIKPIEALRYE